jgi:hypothetical protein
MIQGRGQDNVTIRLLTTITDYTPAVADKLAAVYAERWEHELVFDEIETHQMHASKSCAPEPRNWSNKKSGLIY